MNSVKFQDIKLINRCIAFLNTNNKLLGREIKKTILFTTALKRIKYQDINLTKEIKSLHLKNYKTLRKEVKDGTVGNLKVFSKNLMNRTWWLHSPSVVSETVTMARSLGNALLRRLINRLYLSLDIQKIKNSHIFFFTSSHMERCCIASFSRNYIGWMTTLISILQQKWSYNGL